MAGESTFFREFARSPKSIGSVTPSSRYLAQQMIRSARIQPGNVIVELGAGSGAITRHVVDAFPEHAFISLEPNPEMAAFVRQLLPHVQVVEAYAQELPSVLADAGHTKVDRIVSGLPFASWSDDIQDPIFDAILQCMAPDGVMVSFSYFTSQIMPGAQKLKAKLPRWFGKISRSKGVLRNVPPAFVYILEEPRKR